jgi:alkylation response protein AidB-like acyl-CoA dehydrogenase
VDFSFSEKEQSFYDELNDFLHKELPADWYSKPVIWPHEYAGSPYRDPKDDETRQAFVKKLADKGWLTISWPEEYGGRGYTNIEQAIYDERMSYHLAPASGGISFGIVGPMLLRIGTPEQQASWIPRIASGEISFWLGYSEPNAGSDLGSVGTFARDEGDHFVLNGQKCWSSGAHRADYSWMIVRTDTNARKHQGCSLFIVDNKTPGITMRPVINILGDHSFNEVFMEDAHVPKENLIGEKNKGFYHLMQALDFERISLVGVGTFRRFLEELVEYVKTSQRNGRPLKDVASVRNKLADLATRVEIAYMLFWRTAEMLDRGEEPNVESSALKVMATELARDMAETAMEILGPYGQLTEPSERTPLRALVARGFLESISATIGAGTSEIQRNVIAQRGLGLPRV